MSPPAVVVADGDTHLFLRGLNNEVLTTHKLQGDWAAQWNELPGRGRDLSGPAAVIDGGKRLRVFVRGADNLIYGTVRQGGQWLGWNPVPGLSTEDRPAVLLDSDGSLLLLARGPQGKLHLSRGVGDGPTWSGWSALEALGTPTLTGGPAAALDGKKNLTVLCRASDGVVWRTVRVGSTWFEWKPVVGLATPADPAAISDGNGQLRVYARGARDEVLENVHLGVSWSGWRPLPGAALSTPIPALDADGVTLFVRGPSNALYALGPL
jgi:hypothetical protein